ncbi:CLC5A protein, partial [Cochlearius cochlearius]|nr:CLC5A protein [Cochlearius cochlearius]
MSENLIYADLNLPESTRPRLQNVTDVQGSVYVEVKIQSQDTNGAASYTPSGKSCCSRKCVAVLVAVITLLLVLAVCLILMYHPTASSPPDSETLPTTSEEGLDCPPCWEKNGKKCYFFSDKMEKKDWNASRKECTDMNSDLVIIDDMEEMDYLTSQLKSQYYLLGLTYSMSEKKWKWINNMEYRENTITGANHSDYLCAVIGPKKVETAPCGGSSTTQNMCEKAANISERQKKR